MRAQQYFLSFLATTALVILPSQLSFAFTITPQQPGDSDGTYNYEQSYEDNKGFVRLDAWPVIDPRRYLKGQVLKIQPGGTDGLLSLLNRDFGHAWEFIPKGDLEGSFNIENYFACSPKFACELDNARRFNRIGAAFKLNYRPERNDPTGSTVH